jgi:phenylpropionate dioxygenase-like ring-hydroxylating dioxygenase large terminal subunit
MLKTEPPATKPSAAPAFANKMGDAEDSQALPFGFNDLRDRIPVLGLKEYWYPALQEKRVGWKKPVFLKMLGEDLCLFRGKSGRVAALSNACPHRGAMLSRGNCEFRGTVACFYHGFVFDEHGECLAALGEGPESPMPGKIRARVYPTATMKGIVFVWMGKGEPVPLEENIPEEFFQEDKFVVAWNTEWPANWRPCFENSFDSHVRYLHRNSAMLLMKPLYAPHFPPGRPKRIGKHRLMPTRPLQSETPDGQEYFPGLDATWPRHRRRVAWTWLFDLLRAPFMKLLTPYRASDEWEMGQHLPCMVRINYQTHMWTRWAVPIDEKTTRMFYFHTALRPSTLGRAYEYLAYHLFHHWVMDRNFSAQDAPAAIHAYYDRPEYLAPTDAQLVQWRRFLLGARGMNAPREKA